MNKQLRWNTVLTVFGPVFVSIIVFLVKTSFESKLDAVKASMDGKIEAMTSAAETKSAATYVAKTDFQKSMDDSNKKQDDLTKEVRQNFSTLAIQIGDVAKDVASIKGELTAKGKSN